MKIGTDIVQIHRVETMLEKYGDTFKQRFLVDTEIQTLKKVESIAGYWAAKEAIAKALGCGIGASLTFHDIIISKNHLGAPEFCLSKKAQQHHSLKHTSLSISHDGGFAIAVAVVT